MKEGKQLSSQKSTIRQNCLVTKRKSKTPKRTVKAAFDDIYITHCFKNSQKAVPIKIVESNKIIQRLT